MTKKLNQILSASDFNRLREFYKLKAIDIFLKHGCNEADEDSITGYMTGSLSYTNLITVPSNDQNDFLTLEAYKIRGRGKNAPEKKYGADGIIRLIIKNANDRIIFIKELVFQSKNNWKNKDTSLLNQAFKMKSHFPSKGSSIIINYTKTAYSVFDVDNVIEYNARIDDQPEKTDLAEFLSGKFIECMAGKYYSLSSNDSYNGLMEKYYNTKTGDFIELSKFLQLHNTEVIEKFNNNQFNVIETRLKLNSF